MLSRNIHNNFIIYKLLFHNRHGYLWVCAKCLKRSLFMSICKMPEKEVIVKTIQINFEPYLFEISFIKCLFQLLLGNLITVFVLWCIMLWNDNFTASTSCSGVVIQGLCQIFLCCFLKAAWKTVMEWSELLMETRHIQEHWIIPGLLLSSVT